jgi:hypothetical protein
VTWPVHLKHFLIYFHVLKNLAGCIESPEFVYGTVFFPGELSPYFYFFKGQLLVQREKKSGNLFFTGKHLSDYNQPECLGLMAWNRKLKP